LTADQHDSDRVAIEIDECRNMGIEVKQPDINQSFNSFTVVTSGTEINKEAGQAEESKIIRFGLKAIKNVGEHIAEVVIAERKANGPYKDITDLLERIDDKDLNKKSLESFIKCGAFDKFGERGKFLANIENLLQFSRDISKSKITNQVSLFFDAPNLEVAHRVKLDPAEPVSNAEKLSWEKELLGLYISEHPFNEYKKQLSDIAIPLSELAQHNGKSDVNVAGVIVDIKSILTRKNERMLFVKIEDGVDNVEILVFPRLLKDTAEIWQEGEAVICQGTVSDKDNEIKVLVNKAAKLSLNNLGQDLQKFKKIAVANNKNELKAQPFSQPLKLVAEQAVLKKELLIDLKQLLNKFPGKSKVYLKIVSGDKYKIVQGEIEVDNNEKLRNNIIDQFKNLIQVI
ncbi:MAG: OB-fold nucleic acid binding domain-containing protein, partial [bacterium]